MSLVTIYDVYLRPPGPSCPRAETTITSTYLFAV